jgi:DNA gyrase subunit A
MGRQAAGVRGIRLKKSDVVVGMDVIPEAEAKAKKITLELFTIAENGLGKRTPLDEYKVQNRGGSGIRTMRVTAKTGVVIGAQVSHSDDVRDLILISKKGVVIRVPFKSVPSLGRDTQGVRVMRFREEGDSLSSVTFVSTQEEEVEE